MQLANFVFEHTSEAIMITDANNRIIMVNNKLEQITGYAKSELLGRDPIIFSSGKQDAHFYRHMWHDVIKQGYWKGEVYNRRKSGEVFPEELSLNVVKNQHGIITHYVGIFRDISARKAAEQKLAFYANNEPLTGLFNRRSFIASIEHHIHIAKRHSAAFSVLFIDIDHFTEINDVHGHAFGDKLLQAIAGRLIKNVRDEDIVCRYGSDEFTVLLVNASVENAAIKAEQLLRHLNKTYELGSTTLDITFSLALVQYPDGGQNATVLLSNAEHALNNASNHGLQGIAFYDKQQQHAYLHKLSIRNHLKKAIKQEQIDVYYQPIVNQYTKVVEKFEALVRWRNEKGVFISPGEFIPVAEEFGLIHLIGSFVLRRACRDLKRLHDLGYGNVCFSINRSISEFRYDVDEASIISNTIKQSGLPYSAIVVEITETVAMSSNTHTEQILNTLRDKGVKIALDDFGTGNSSLSNLIDYKSDFLKIDKSFIDSMVTDKNHQVLVSTLIDLATKLDMDVIAEGVETAEQLVMLGSFGCQYIQGYYYSPAIPIDQCIELLKQPIE